MIVEKDQSRRLILKYGDKKGSMSFSNVDPDADNNVLYELAEALNLLQAETMEQVFSVSNTTLEME